MRGLGIWYRSKAKPAIRWRTSGGVMTLLIRSVWICHMPEARREASSTEGSPVVARRKSAVPIAPAIVRPPTTSPNAGLGPAGHSSSGLVKICCIPLRAQ